MKRKAILTGVIFLTMTLGAALLNSCDGLDDCGTIDYTPQEAINFSGMAVTIAGRDNSGELFQVVTYTNQTLRYDSIGLQMNYDLREVSENVSDINFTKSAYACSLLPPFSYLYEVAVYSDSDYSSAYPAGTNLADIVRVSFGFRTATESSNSNLELDGSSLMVVLNQAPDAMGTHNFRVEVNYDSTDSSESIIQFSPVTIRP